MASMKIPRAEVAGVPEHDTRASRWTAFGRRKIRQAVASLKSVGAVNSTVGVIEPLEGRRHLTAVTRFVLVDAVTNQDLFQLDTSKPINLAALPSKKVNIRADGDSTTESVDFFLNGKFARRENGVPYALFSDNKGDYYTWTPSVGNFNLSAIPYSKDGGLGTKGPTASVPFTVVNEPVNVVQQSVTGFTLYNADTNQPIRTLHDDDTINLNLLPTRNISIKAETSSGLGSVAFDLDGTSNFFVDSTADYFIKGDNGAGDVNAWNASTQEHTLTARPINTNPSLTGQFIGKSLTFTVTESADIEPTVSIVNPVANTVKAGPGNFVILASAADVDGSVTKVEFYANSKLIGSTTDLPYSIAWTNVQPGTYKVVAKAYDNVGQSATSSAVTVTVKPFTTERTYYVSPTGNDSNAGTSSSSPFKTINRAAQFATAGSTVLIQPGRYRETVWLPKNGTSDRPITFKAVTPGTVIIDGADVISGWTPESGAVYSTNWAYDFFMQGSRKYGPFTDGTEYAEQFMVGNTMLKRVESKDQMFAGAFWINYDADKAYVWLPNSTDPRKTQVLGSTRQTLFAPARLDWGMNIRVEGLSFIHAANFVQPQQAAVRTSNGWVMINTTIEYTNSTGLGVFGNDIALLNVKSDHNGQAGISSGKSTNVLVKDGSSIGNNTREIRIDWEGGGGKWSKTHNIYVLGFTAGDNKGHGIWFDTDNTNIVVMNSRVYNNTGFGTTFFGAGIFTEQNPGPIRFEGNYATGMSTGGIRVAESQNVVIKNNTLIGSLRGVEIRNMPNRLYTTKNIKVVGNKFKGWKESAVGTLQGVWDAEAPTKLNLTIDGNFYDLTGLTATRIFRWGWAPYKTIADYNAATGLEDNGKLASVTAP